MASAKGGKGTKELEYFQGLKLAEIKSLEKIVRVRKNQLLLYSNIINSTHNVLPLDKVKTVNTAAQVFSEREEQINERLAVPDVQFSDVKPGTSGVQGSTPDDVRPSTSGLQPPPSKTRYEPDVDDISTDSD